MALRDKTKVQKEIKIRENGVDILDTLHPKFVKPFNSIIGKVNSLENALLFLSREFFPVQKLDKELSPGLRKKIFRSKVRSLPNYWYIVELIATDRVLMDKAIVKELISIPEVEKTYFKIYHKIKKGVIETEVENEKLRRLAKQYKIITLNILDVVKEMEINPDEITELPLKEYKEFKNKTKEKIWNDIIKRKEGRIMENISDVSDEDVYKIFMS